MANIKSQKKRILVSERQHNRNKPVISALKTELRKSKALIEAGDKDAAAEQVRKTIKALDMAAQKKIVHRKNVANKKSSLVLKLNKIS